MMKVLIIEDDVYVQQVLKNVLSRMDLEVVVCTTGSEAIDIMTREKIRLALIDWVLPEPAMDGLMVCRKVRKMRLSRYVYMIVLTARTDKEDLVEALDSGADDYIRKPFDEGELAARVRVGLRIIQLENKLVNSQRKLMALAREDPLTKLFNRRALFDEVLKELNRSMREKGNVATMLLDVDGFKAINDNHGHLAGDIVLVEVARRLKDACREYDLVGRYGGEEFFMLLPHTDRAGALKVAERIRTAMRSKPVEFGKNKISFTASIGLYCTSFESGLKGQNVNERLLDEMIKKTDYALYAAKRGGKNRVAIYKPS